MLGLIKRAPRAEHYTVLNTATFNIEMPADCLGVYLYLLSKPDDWTVRVTELSKRFGTGRDKTYKILNKLRQICVNGCPLVDRKEIRDQGKIVRYDYVVNEPFPEKPYTAKPETENPDTEKPLTANQDLRNNRDIQTTDSTKEGQKRKRFVPPSVEEVAEYCKERNNGIDPEHFVDFYVSKNWYIGKNKMKDWKATVRTWEKRQKQNGNGKTMEERLNDTSWL